MAKKRSNFIIKNHSKIRQLTINNNFNKMMGMGKIKKVLVKKVKEI
jgi:hypothetical protein